MSNFFFTSVAWKVYEKVGKSKLFIHGCHKCKEKILFSFVCFSIIHSSGFNNVIENIIYSIRWKSSNWLHPLQWIVYYSLNSPYFHWIFYSYVFRLIFRNYFFRKSKLNLFSIRFFPQDNSFALLIFRCSFFGAICLGRQNE